MNLLNSQRTIRDATRLLVLVAILVLAVSCDETTSVVLRNESSKPVVYVSGGGRTHELLPETELSIGHLPGSDLSLRLDSRDGSAIFNATIKWKQLESLGFRVVVTDAGVDLPTP